MNSEVQLLNEHLLVIQKIEVTDTSDKDYLY